MSTFTESVHGESLGVIKTKSYYEALGNNSNLKTDACCTSEKPSLEVREALKNIKDECIEKYYGCGLVFPGCIKGLHILDLGCGAGRDAFVMSQLVGPEGLVTGVDFSNEMLSVGIKNIDWHMSRFSYPNSNVRFLQANIEDLSSIASDSVDVIISNCVVNLSQNKRSVFAEAYRVLKKGGEMYFSDVYSSRRLPQALRDDEVIWGECISGALYWNDFLRLAKQEGFLDPRLVKSRLINVNNARIQERLGDIRIFSATYRLFKLPELEPDCEDYGQAVIYKGTIASDPYSYILDDHHIIETGKVFPVCGNTFRMLHDTRLREHFTFLGDWSRHFGIFSGCGKSMPFETAPGKQDGASCC